MAAVNGECRDRVILDQWHPLWAADVYRVLQPYSILLYKNQNPKRLPLDPRAETPIRSDQASITYRRWLSDLGVTYGMIPAT